MTARIALTSAAVSAVGVRLGLCNVATLSIGLRGTTSWPTAKPKASRSTVLARFERAYESRPSCFSNASHRATPISRRVRCWKAGRTSLHRVLVPPSSREGQPALQIGFGEQ